MNNKSIMDNLLINPKLRVVRHILLIGAGAVISFNQTFLFYQDSKEVLGNNLFLIGFFSLCLYVLMIYFNMYVLVPEFLLKRKYTTYISLLSLSVLAFLLLQNYKDFLVYRHWNIPDYKMSYFNIVTILDLISNFLLYSTCVIGISLTILMKNWLVTNKRVNRLKKKQVLQEVEQLKEQVNPNMLFKILNRTGALSKFEPEKAMDMLYRLSLFLRYQLYDCMREKILLTSVINFLQNYLTLEKIYSQQFDYTLKSEGNIPGLFVEPLIFMPFIKKVIEEINKSDELFQVDIHFFTKEDSLYFVCHINRALDLKQNDFSKIRQRLELLYKDNYQLQLENDEKNGEYTIQLQLKFSHGSISK